MKLKNGKKKLYKYKYDFQQYETIRSFKESIYTGKINIDEAKTDQSSLFENLVEFNDKSRPGNAEGKDKKGNAHESTYAVYKGQELILKALKSGIFPKKEAQEK